MRSSGAYRHRCTQDGTTRRRNVKRLLDKLRTRRKRQDDGASAVEYGLLVALIAVVIAGTVVVLGNALQNKLNDACQSVAAGTTETCPADN
jgi:pilus assembly protein Flp/PilA